MLLMVEGTANIQRMIHRPPAARGLQALNRRTLRPGRAVRPPRLADARRPPGRLADDLDGGEDRHRAAGHETDPGRRPRAATGGSLHRLVLGGRWRHYPTVGGAWSSRRRTSVGLLAARGDAGRPRAPSGERGRAARPRSSARCCDGAMAAAGGLQGRADLQADRFRWPGRRVGRPGPAPSCSRTLERHSATGGRRAASGSSGAAATLSDATNREGRLTLTSYVWPDMTGRHQRPGRSPLLSHPAGAGRIGTPRRTSSGSRSCRGGLTAPWHSVMWQYVPREQQAVTTRLDDLGREASEEAPLVHLYAEPTRRTGRGRPPVLGLRAHLARTVRAGVPGPDGGPRRPRRVGVTRCVFLARAPTLALRTQPRAARTTQSRRDPICWRRATTSPGGRSAGVREVFGLTVPSVTRSRRWAPASSRWSV